MWVEKTLKGTKTDLGAAVVAFERSPKYVRFLAEVVRVVGNAAVRRQFTSKGKLRVSGLVMAKIGLGRTV